MPRNYHLRNLRNYLLKLIIHISLYTTNIKSLYCDLKKRKIYIFYVALYFYTDKKYLKKSYKKNSFNINFIWLVYMVKIKFSQVQAIFIFNSLTLNSTQNDMCFLRKMMRKNVINVSLWTKNFHSQLHKVRLFSVSRV